jgi:hypothetical protein
VELMSIGTAGKSPRATPGNGSVVSGGGYDLLRFGAVVI